MVFTSETSPTPTVDPVLSDGPALLLRLPPDCLRIVFSFVAPQRSGYFLSALTALERSCKLGKHATAFLWQQLYVATIPGLGSITEAVAKAALRRVYRWESPDETVASSSAACGGTDGGGGGSGGVVREFSARQITGASALAVARWPVPRLVVGSENGDITAYSNDRLRRLAGPFRSCDRLCLNEHDQRISCLLVDARSDTLFSGRRVTATSLTPH